MRNSTGSTRLYFIESFTFYAWLFYVFPYLVFESLMKRERKKKKICYIDGSKLAIFVASTTLSLLGIRLEKLKFRLVDIRDEEGNLLRLRIAYKDLAELQEQIKKNPIFQDLLQDKTIKNRMPTFLSKQITTINLSSNQTLWRALLVIHIVAWKTKNEKDVDSDVVLFMNKRMWLKEIKKYASEYRVSIIPVRTMQKVGIRDILGILGLKDIAKYLYYYFLSSKSMHFIKRVPLRSPTLGVEYYGHLDLDQPELKSDLFFWQKSQLSGKDILITFSKALVPLDRKKWTEITKYNMTAVALNPRATRISSAPIFHHLPCFKKRNFPKKRRSPEYRWVKHNIKDYYDLYDYWVSFFKRYNIKIYISWYKHGSTHIVIADALQNLGGINVIYQRSFEEFPSAETTVASDIVFGFSKAGAYLERLSNSIIPYYVVTGYIGDHRFVLLKEQAKVLRDKLRKKGANRILAFFDENSMDDSRWHTGHEIMRENYAFLLEKVLSEPWLGLVLKPKTPLTLRRRLGNVTELLKRAEETGRCFVFEDGVLQGLYPPCAAALVSDIAIHGHLCAATAGVESALAGVPTLLMDREGWPVSKLYKLGKRRVVFTNWQELWKTAKKHWDSSNGMPGFGDWSFMLDELDPFRDGRTAERIGTYLKWLLDGFKSGLSREIVLADAAERYSKVWGRDKIIEVNSNQ